MVNKGMVKVAAEPPADARMELDSDDDEDDDDEEPEVWDTIVIGSGIGGLSVASLLAQIKKDKVLVVEQHPEHSGGACHGFEEKGFPFAAGIHYIGEMGEGDPLKAYMDALTLPNDHIPWSRLPDNYESVMIGGESESNGEGDESHKTMQRYDWIANNQEEALKSQFPNDKQAIERFFQEMKKAAAAFERSFLFKALPRFLVSFLIMTGLIRFLDKGYSKYANISLREVTNSITDNALLRTVLEYIYGDYGSSPSEAPFMLHAGCLLHYAKGAYYPTGGPQVIAERIARAITKHGGEVRINSRVRAIWVEQGRAVGIKLANGLWARSKRVISDAGIYNTSRHLVPEAYCPSHIRGKSTPLDSMVSCFCLFVGIEGDPQADLGISPTILRSCNKDYEPMPTTIQGMLQIPPESLEVFVSSPTASDQSAKECYPNKTSLQIICEAPYEPFADWDNPKTHKVDRNNKQEYQSFKDAFAQKMYARARDLLIAAGAASDKLPLRLEDTAVAEMGTPLTMERYLATEHGAVYALDHNMIRFGAKTFLTQLRPDSTLLPGLYFTGQDVSTCGLAGAMLGGYMCAGKILGNPNPSALVQEVKKSQA
mmetsp:Transcript_24051/g.66712  ORF Transcript_24051/g.66712 Transcript_24051/m.66712 type:complete len:598 (-) Transcript_24051:72-1865(-)